MDHCLDVVLLEFGGVEDLHREFPAGNFHKRRAVEVRPEFLGIQGGRHDHGSYCRQPLVELDGELPWSHLLFESEQLDVAQDNIAAVVYFPMGEV